MFLGNPNATWRQYATPAELRQHKAWLAEAARLRDELRAAKKAAARVRYRVFGREWARKYKSKRTRSHASTSPTASMHT